MSSEFESTTDRILRLMKDTFGETFKTYYDGDPEAIPTFNLPALIVTQTTASITTGDSASDDVEDSLTVKVVFNKRDDWTGDKVNPVELTDRKIRDFIMRRDTTTKQYDPTSVVGALRKYSISGDRYGEGITGLAEDIKVEYGINPRPTPDTSFADITSEGHVSFSVQYTIFDA